MMTTNGLDSETPAKSSASKPHAKLQKPASASASGSYHGLTYWIERIGRSGTQRVGPSTVFKSGDRIRIHVRSNRSGYLYVVNQGSSGRGSFLFPTSANADEYVEANRVYTIPVSGHIRFDDQPGEEIVWLFLSQRPLPVDVPGQNRRLESRRFAAKEADYNPCGSKDLVVESPDALQTSCGAGSKDLV